MVSNPASFHAEARYQIACFACGKIGKPFHAHHVVDQAELKSWGVPKADRYDTRLAMRLCSPGTADNCHFQFENRRIAVFLDRLTDEMIEAAFEHGGTRAYDYLKREYAGEDARVERMLDEITIAVGPNLYHGGDRT